MDVPSEEMSGEAEADARSMAQAAAEAAAAAESGEDPNVCRICGHGDDGRRRLVRFLPVEVDMSATAVAPMVLTWAEDITLHEFCGKTAGIMPNSTSPHYEILAKPGIKNKHGIGAEVDAALARSRYAVVKQNGKKDVYFYLVKEFEAHLQAIRNVRTQHKIQYQQARGMPPLAGYYQDQVGVPHASLQNHSPPFPSIAPNPRHLNVQDHYTPRYAATSAHEARHRTKVVPVKATTGTAQKLGTRKEGIWLAYPVQDESSVTADGKIRCGCGGTYLSPGTAKGAVSWRAHITTKRHQKWMEENGQLGAV